MSSHSIIKERTVLRFIDRLGLLLIVMLVTCQANLAATIAQESIPETPAGQCLAQLIDAINNDDENVRMEYWKEGFVANDDDTVNQRKQRTDRVRERLGKITLKEVTSSTEFKIGAACDTTAGPVVLFAISVSEEPHKIKTIALELVDENPSGKNDQRFRLDAETRTAILNQLVKSLSG